MRVPQTNPLGATVQRLLTILITAHFGHSLFDQNGFMFDDVAHMSSDIAAANADGTYTVNMGCGADAENNLPISNDTGVFNFVVRHYIPSERVKFGGYRLMPLIQRVE